MGTISVNGILARYQHSFGYVAGNVALAAGNRLWSVLKRLPHYSTSTSGPGSDEPIQLFEVASTSFAEVTLTNSKSGNVYRFGFDGTYGKGRQYLAPPLMLSFSRGKNVVKTAIDRSEVEVIEYFGLKPYAVKVQGILIDMDGHQYPQHMLREVHKMFEEPGTFKVEGTIFSDLGITELFLEDGLDISFVEGYADTVKFSVDATSTTPLELVTVGG